MRNPLSRSRALSLLALAGIAFGLSGCAASNMLANNSTDTVASGLTGIIHGGPNPIVGATISVYATTSNGYGIGTAALQSTSTDGNGSFSFPGGYTCPAGQSAYIVSYGGNTGGNTNNPNSVEMAALGPCNSLYSGTTYTGGFVWIDELTTVAAGYALSNFMKISGDAVHGYSVGIGAPATNNAVTPCIANAYYTGCTQTAAAGLGHAFANAAALVNTSTGVANRTTPTANGSAVIPFQMINTLGDILQACVNSNGGGTDAVTGLPTTTTTASGTSYVGTSACAKLFAYTSYTSNGLPSGTLVAAGNTLDAIKNLAKRPSGSAAFFDTNCDSQTAATPNTGSMPAATCIFNLSSSISFYVPQMSAAPSDPAVQGSLNSYTTSSNSSAATAPGDWMLGIQYPKGGFSTGVNTATCNNNAVPATQGLLYPFDIATDIADNLTILNADGGGPICTNLITVTSSGELIGGSPYNPNNLLPVKVTLDAWGHAIIATHNTNTSPQTAPKVPENTTGAASTINNGVLVFAAGASDTTLTLLQAITSPATSGSSVTPALIPFYTAVNASNDIYVASHNSVSNLGVLTPTTQSHLSPVYALTSIGPVTPQLDPLAIDLNNNVLSSTTSGSGVGRSIGVAAGATTYLQSANNLGGTTSPGMISVVDTAHNQWNIINNNVLATSTSTTVGVTPYSVTGSTFSFGSNPTSATTPTYSFSTADSSPALGQIDGDGTIWWGNLQGNTSSTAFSVGWIRGYDTVNNYGTVELTGCKFASTTATHCGTRSGDAGFPSSIPYLFFGIRGLSIDSAGSIWTANGIHGTITEIIGTAAPTWPLFLHNGTSNKP